MAQAISIYDHFIIWPSSVTFTFNLTEQMFKMTLLLLTKNNWVIFFLNPCINVGVMAQTCYINYHFIIWPSIVTLTFKLPEYMFQMALVLLKKNSYARFFQNACINVDFMGPNKLNLLLIYQVTFKCDLDLPSTWINVSMAPLLLKQNNCVKLF